MDWLTEETCTRVELRDSCVGAVLGALHPLLGGELLRGPGSGAHAKAQGLV